uniref:ABC transporter n=1 Tax=Ditylenchus dipsaci TaxID=166011 RepID=A0A915DU97_9BILA
MIRTIQPHFTAWSAALARRRRDDPARRSQGRSYCANGAGKSSLFALLRGELSPDAGDCQLPGDWRIAHMRQEVDTLDRLAVDYVLDGDVRLRKVQAELAAAEQAHDGTALARLHSELESADGYTADARARKLLAGLALQRADGPPSR